MKTIDLNADIGEGVGDDAAILDVITSANIACGHHAGGPEIMGQTSRWAIEKGVVIGAHPGFPDPENFGRTSMRLSREAIRAHLAFQIGALTAIAKAEGGRVSYVKPHGALYNQCFAEQDTAEAVLSAIADVDPNLILMTAPGSALAALAKERQHPFVLEAFADRGYLPTGELMQRGTPGAVHESTDKVVAQAFRIAETRSVTAPTGEEVSLPVSTLCLHGDTPGALAHARAVKSAFADAAIAVEPFA